MKTLTYLEAWQDFYAWIQQPGNWERVDRAGRDRIGKAQRRYKHKKPAPLKYEGVRALLAEYGKERYETVEGFRLIE